MGEQEITENVRSADKPNLGTSIQSGVAFLESMGFSKTLVSLCGTEAAPSTLLCAVLSEGIKIRHKNTSDMNIKEQNTSGLLSI